MTVNQEVKGTLAKLLATENLTVEHRKVTTASFDVKTESSYFLSGRQHLIQCMIYLLDMRLDMHYIHQTNLTMVTEDL